MNKILFLLLLLPCFVFGQTTDATLTTQAQQIKNETTAGANTANRVGTHLQNLVYSKKSFFSDGTASGTDTYAVTLDNGAITSLTNQWFVIKFTNANTGSATLNINAIGAKTLKKAVSTNLSSGDIAAGSIHLLVYDGTNLQVLSLGGGGGGAGTVTSVGWTGGIISIATATTTPAFTIAGTSGGIPYFNSSSTWATSGALAANALVIGGGAGAAPATTTTGTGVLTALGNNANTTGGFTTNNVVGAQDLFITGPAFWPKATSGAQVANPFEIGGTATFMALDFDQTTGENAQFQVQLPRNWNNGTVTCTVYWTAISGSASQTVQWDVSAVAFSNDDPLSGAFGSVVEIDDTLIATSDLHISPISSAITIGGTPADGDLVLFNIARDPSEDNLAADAKMLGVRVTITLDAATSE